MIGFSVWLAPALLLALSATESCAVGAVDAQILAKTVALPFATSKACEIRSFEDISGRSFVDVRDAQALMLLDAQGLSLARMSIQALSASANSTLSLVLIGSGLDDQNIAKLCGQRNLESVVVILKGGARAWRGRYPQPGFDEEINATEALRSIKQGQAELLQIGAPEQQELFTGLAPRFAPQLNPRLVATLSKKPVVVLSTQPIKQLPHNWFLVRGGAIALANALELANKTNRQPDALKRPCFYP